MKRLELFEFEDQSWFPNWIRQLMTRYIIAVHKVIGTSESIAVGIADILQKTDENRIIDLCSGGGGPMLEVKKILLEKYGRKNIELSLSDLYPNLDIAKIINNDSDESVNYITTPINAAHIPKEKQGLRTMICSFHHMNPQTAKAILKNAKDDRQPIYVFEISDNSIPFFISWIAVPVGFLMSLFITPFVRPMSWQQLFFTYIIPILPFFIAWDGGVSNMRTYTLEDMDELLEGLESEQYKWEKGKIEGKGGNKLFLKGIPV